MPFTETSLRWTLHLDTLSFHPYLLSSHYFVVSCSLAFLHSYCTYCSSLITLYTFLRYLGSLSCAHYLIPNITNAPLILFLCSSSLVSALSCRCVWLSLSLPTLVEPCSCLVTKLATCQSLIQFVISLAFNPLTP